MSERDLCLHVVYGPREEVDRAAAAWADAVTWIVEATDGDFAVRAFGHPRGRPAGLPALSPAGSLVVDALDGAGLAALVVGPAAEAARLRRQHALVVTLKRAIDEMVAGLTAAAESAARREADAAGPFSLN